MKNHSSTKPLFFYKVSFIFTKSLGKNNPLLRQLLLKKAALKREFHCIIYSMHNGARQCLWVTCVFCNLHQCDYPTSTPYALYHNGFIRTVSFNFLVLSVLNLDKSFKFFTIFTQQGQFTSAVSNVQFSHTK